MGVLVTVSTPEPWISIEEAKAQVRVLHPDEDELIQAYTDAACSYIDGPQGILGRCIGRHVLEYRSHGFTAIDRLPLGPITSVQTIKYVDQTGVEQTLDGALYALADDRLVLTPGAYWPRVRGAASDVVVRYEAGSETIPTPVKQAALLLIGQWYSQRSSAIVGTIVNEMPNGVKALLAPYKVRRF